MNKYSLLPNLGALVAPQNNIKHDAVSLNKAKVSGKMGRNEKQKRGLHTLSSIIPFL